MITEFPAAALDQKAPFQVAPEAAFSFGQMEGGDEVRFTSVVAGARLADGSFVVVDERESLPLRVLDAEGGFVQRIGARGEGPGELVRPAGLQVDTEGRLLVWDRGRDRLHLFDPRGGFVRDFSERDLGSGSILGFRSQADGSFLLIRETDGTGPPEPGINRRSNQGRLVRARDGAVDTLATFAGTEWELRVHTDGGAISGVEIARPWYLPRLLHSFGERGVWISTGARWEVIRRGSSGATEVVLRFDRPPEGFTTDRVRELHQAMLAAATGEVAEEGVHRRIELEEYPQVIPPIAALFSDAEDRLWVGLTSFPPPENLPGTMGRPVREWLILEEGARSVVGRITLPPRSRPLHADADGVFIVVVDEFGIPRVEWRLFKPG